jgi:hypothetical protein
MEQGTKITGAGLAVKNGGVEFGNMATRARKYDFDVGCLRPFFGKDGKAYINIRNRQARSEKDPKYIKLQVANATLTYDQWKEIETTVQEAARVRTPAVTFLRGRGLAKSFSGFGKTIHKRQRRKEKTGAQRSMDALTQGQENALVYDDVDTPLPINHDQFGLTMRQMAIGDGTDGADLQADNIFESTRNVVEDVEETLLTDTTFTYGGATVYSAINHPNRNTVSLAQNWDDSGKTGEEIVDDVSAMVQAARNDRQYGEGVLLTPTGYDQPLDADFKANGSLTVRQRIKELTGITDVITCDKLPADTVVWIQLDRRTFMMLDGLPLTTIEWSTFGGLQVNWKIITIQVPDFRPDYAGRLGLVVLS